MTMSSYRTFAAQILSVGLCLALAACNSGDGTPPALAILSPAAGSPVSGTTTVQVSTPENADVERVTLYARGAGSERRGRQVGSAVQGPPFVVSWNTTDVPNLAELELVAVGRDKDGDDGESDPVAVRVQNGGAPTLQLLTAYTIAPEPEGVDALGVSRKLSELVNAAEVRPPLEATPITDKSESTLETTQAEAVRDYVLEWQWEPFAEAESYRVMSSTSDVVGPYREDRWQSAGAGTGAQKFSKTLEGAQAGDRFYGAVRALTGGNSQETGYSNADAATFLPPQGATAPEDGARVDNGRPVLSWPATPGADGYLYYLYDRDPWAEGAVLLWSNFPQSDGGRTASFPANRDALPSGTYGWWVAGISFDANGKADGFSFSEPRSFQVP